MATAVKPQSQLILRAHLEIQLGQPHSKTKPGGASLSLLLFLRRTVCPQPQHKSSLTPCSLYGLQTNTPAGDQA